jgi:hypothetical protein
MDPMTLQSQSPRPTVIREASPEKGGLGAANYLVFGTLALAGVIVGGVLLYNAFKRPSGGGGTPTAEIASSAGTTDPLASAAGTPGATTTPMPVAEPAGISMGVNPADKPLVPAPSNSPTTTPTTPSGTGAPSGPTGSGGPAPNLSGGPANPATENPSGPRNPATTPGATPVPATGGTLPTQGSNAPAMTGPGGQGGGLGGPSAEVREWVESASRAIAAGRLVEGRTLLNKALLSEGLPKEERAALRSQIATVNDTLLFSAVVTAGDPLVDSYVIQPGDSLVTLTRKQGLPVDWRFIQRINKITRPEALRVGQKIKVVRQPFHAIVHKGDYRLDLYAGDPVPAGGSLGRRTGPDGQDESWTFIRSFKVGLGESNGTPEGAFVVRPKSKLVNPAWVNPRTGEKFAADDPKNPIGERWIGLDGVDESTRRFQGYGIHGTIEPDSIGQQRSMGCVRMKTEDVEIIYELLLDRVSTVKILP